MDGTVAVRIWESVRRGEIIRLIVHRRWPDLRMLLTMPVVRVLRIEKGWRGPGTTWGHLIARRHSRVWIRRKLSRV